MVLFSMVLLTLLFPVAAPNFAAQDIAKEFVAKYDGKSPVYVMKFLRPGFAFYSHVYGSEVKTDEDLKQAIHSVGQAYFIIREGEYKQLMEEEREMLSILAGSADKLLLLKK